MIMARKRRYSTKTGHDHEAAQRRADNDSVVSGSPVIDTLVGRDHTTKLIETFH
jgi:hypothetical protein